METKKSISEVTNLAAAYSAQEVWKQLRAELAEPIAKAHEVLVEHQGATQLRSKLGLGLMERKHRVGQILGDWRPADGTQFVLAYRQLQSVTHPPEAIELMRQFMASISFRFMAACGQVLQKAAATIAAKQAEALKIEQDFFATAGLAHQRTDITGGVNGVAEKITSLTKFFGVASHGIITPSLTHLGELFADEAAKQKVVEAEILESGDYTITVSNKLRFSPGFKENLPAKSVSGQLEPKG